MNLNNELKQCPFCGREAELRHDEEGFSYVVCANDGCYVRTAGDLNDDAAIRNWNKRDQWIPCKGCKDCIHKECEHYGKS